MKAIHTVLEQHFGPPLQQSTPRPTIEHQVPQEIKSLQQTHEEEDTEKNTEKLIHNSKATICKGKCSVNLGQATKQFCRDSTPIPITLASASQALQCIRHAESLELAGQG